MIKASYGQNHLLMLKSDSTVWALGLNDEGELGDGTFITSATPVQVQNLTKIQDISAGNGNPMALGMDGTVWTWGKNGTSVY